MNPEETKAFEDKIQAFVGREVGPKAKGPDDVNSAMIRHWCEVMGDENPAYTAAGASSKGDQVAPPAMLQAWSMEGYPMADNPAVDVQRELHNVFDEHGFTGVLGTNCTQEYFRDLKVGDEVHAHTIIDSISEQKATQRGIGYFIETVTTFTDQNDEEVGKMVFRVLKFIPNESNSAVDAGEDDAPKAATRIPSPRGFDNKWWWEAADQGKCLIQRFPASGMLYHPPRPMCGESGSTEFDYIESTLDGEIFSFVEMCYPKFPGYQYPLFVAVVSLAEGTRIVANVNGVDGDSIHIGMKVKGVMEQVDEATVLPVFYPVEK